MSVGFSKSQMARLSRSKSFALLAYPMLTAAAFAVAVVLVGVIAPHYANISYSIFPTSNTSQMLVMASMLYGITLLLMLYVPRLLTGARTTLEELGMHLPLTWRDLLYSVPAFIIAFGLSAVLVMVVAMNIPGFNIQEEQVTGFEGIANVGDKVIAFVALVILAPVIEEVIFRGYLYGKLRTRGVGLVLSIIMTSLIFALAHVQANVAVNVFGLSLVLCALREFTGTIWAGVLVHMIKNGIAFYLLFINPVFLTTMGG